MVPVSSAMLCDSRTAVASSIRRLDCRTAASDGVLKRRAIARFEIFLMATRDPDVAHVMDRHKAAFVEFGHALMPDAGPEEALTATTAAIALVEGLLLSNVRAPDSPWRRAELEALFLTLLPCASG